MRGGVVAGGVALIIIGAIFFYVSNTAVGTATGPGGGFVGYRTEHQIFMMIGVILGIVGFIVLVAGLAASKKENPVMPQTVVVQPSAAPKEPETLLICPECGARVSAKSKFCPECGEKLGLKTKAGPRETKEEKTEAPKSTEGKPEKASFCMYCGIGLPEDLDFCPACGKKVKKIR